MQAFHAREGGWMEEAACVGPADFGDYHILSFNLIVDLELTPDTGIKSISFSSHFCIVEL